ncbi:hypothetical protein BGZ94_002098 [Podila epigama]|nr:hypothetical protein BGZ94_002098 [Podila epigama]
MNAFNVETTLDTKEPFTLELLGPPSSTVHHRLTGTVHLHVTKPVQLKQLSVAFVGEVVPVKGDGVNICKREHVILDTPTTYVPGDYTFTFDLSIPGDLATTKSSKLKNNALHWGYDLITSVIPMGLFSRRKMVRQTLELRRVLVLPSDMNDMRYSAKRVGEFECFLYVPKLVDVTQEKIQVRIYMHSLEIRHRVKDVQALVIQTEKIEFDYGQVELAMGRDDIRPISKVVAVPNPDKATFTPVWGREHPVELDIPLITKDISPSEDITWLSVAHRIRITINFADSSIKQLNVLAPFTAINVLEELWSLQETNDGVTPPDYGDENAHDALLDSNTSRVSQATIFSGLYPEREPIVSVPTDDLPPGYDDEGDNCPIPYEMVNLQ